MPISKLEAAQRQLDCAIRLLFTLDDMPSVITLSRAAFRILLDIYPVLKPDGKFGAQLSQVIKGMGWSNFNKIANELKHAERDAEATIEPHQMHAMVGIGIAITLYHQITEAYTPEMQAFEMLMTILEPDVFGGPHDPSAKAYEDFIKARERLRDATHEQQMEFCRGSLHFLKTGIVADKDPSPPGRGH